MKTEAQLYFFFKRLIKISMHLCRLINFADDDTNMCEQLFHETLFTRVRHTTNEINKPPQLTSVIRKIMS